MRFYFEDEKQHIVNMIFKENLNDNLTKYVFLSEEQNIPLEYWVRKLGEKYFYSKDQVSWKKLPKVQRSNSYVLENEDYRFFKGYRPSSVGENQEGVLITKIPGKIIKILVQEGDEVEQGQPLVILEAMKMENELKASLAGKIKSILVKENQTVEQGVLLLEMEQ